MCDPICRICLNNLDIDDPDGGSVYDLKIQTAMKRVLGFEVCFATELPMLICKHCSWCMRDFQCFSEKAQKNQEQLIRKYLPGRKTDPVQTNIWDKFVEKMDRQSYDREESWKKTSDKSKPAWTSSSTMSTCYDSFEEAQCKTEQDEFDVIDEPHPDFMEVSSTEKEQWRSIITCEDYKISSPVHNATNCSVIAARKDNYEETMEENNNPLGEPVSDKQGKSTTEIKQQLKDCAGRSNCRTDQQCDGMANHEKQNTSKPSIEPPKVRTEKENEPTTTDHNGHDFICGVCGKLYVSERKLQLHRLASHQKQACVICGKTLLRKSMSKHLRIHKKDVIRSSAKTQSTKAAKAKK